MRMVLGPVGVALGVDTSRAAGCRWSRSPADGLIVLVRYVVAVEPLASHPHDELVATYAPTLQRYLEAAA